MLDVTSSVDLKLFFKKSLIWFLVFDTCPLSQVEKNDRIQVWEWSSFFSTNLLIIVFID